jgi:hypothetical protein
LVSNANDVAGSQAANSGVGGVHPGGFTAVDLALLTGGADIELAVQSRFGLVRDQM